MQVNRIIEVERHPQGPRVRLLGQRLHHGAGALMLAGTLACFQRTRALAPLFLLGAVHDRHDWRWWFAPGDPQKQIVR